MVKTQVAPTRSEQDALRTFLGPTNSAIGVVTTRYFFLLSMAEVNEDLGLGGLLLP